MVDLKKRRCVHDNAHEDDDHACFRFLHCKYILFMYFLYSISFVYGFDSRGNKKEELPRERKDLERDIFAPLGKYMFRRAYIMNKASFYKLHSILNLLLLLLRRARCLDTNSWSDVGHRHTKFFTAL